MESEREKCMTTMKLSASASCIIMNITGFGFGLTASFLNRYLVHRAYFEFHFDFFCANDEFYPLTLGSANIHGIIT